MAEGRSASINERLEARITQQQPGRSLERDFYLDPEIWEADVEWADDAWTRRGTDVDGEALGSDHYDYVAVSLSDDGDTVAVGSPNFNSLGLVRIYDWQ